MMHTFTEINLSDNEVVTKNKHPVSNEKYLILQKALGCLYEDFGKIRLELLDKDDETIDIIDYYGTNSCVNQGKTLKYKDGIILLKWDVRGVNSFAIGRANVVAKFGLTREQILSLKNIKVGFANIYEN